MCMLAYNEGTEQAVNFEERINHGGVNSRGKMRGAQSKTRGDKKYPTLTQEMRAQAIFYNDAKVRISKR